MAAIEELKNGIKDGSITVSITFKCSWCGETFNSSEEFDAHLVNGKTIDPNTGKFRRICGN